MGCTDTGSLMVRTPLGVKELLVGEDGTYWAIRDGLTRADRRDRSIAVGTLTDEDVLDPIIDVMEED